jgi:hypothetical protein
MERDTILLSSQAVLPNRAAAMIVEEYDC